MGIIFTDISYAYKKTSLSSKKALLSIYQNHRYTFFCNQPFAADGKLSYQACKECPRVITSVQWMPIVPLKRMVEHKSCYQEKICLDSKGDRFKGLRCCQKIDPLYQKMSTDLHNFVPEHPLLKRLKGNLNYGMASVEKNNVDGCYLYIDKQKKIVEPANHIKGMIARIYFYMRDTYGLHLSLEETEQYLQWHHAYPASVFEKFRNEKIRELQGNKNK